ncbi:hypothetical protein [Marinobacter sp. W-8]
MAITNTGGFAAKPDAKAFALSPAKMKTARAINTEAFNGRAQHGL